MVIFQLEMNPSPLIPVDAKCLCVWQEGVLHVFNPEQTRTIDILPGLAAIRLGTVDKKDSNKWDITGIGQVYDMRDAYRWLFGDSSIQAFPLDVTQMVQ